MLSSNFIKLEDATKSTNFEKKVPIKSDSKTSECFAVEIDGKQYFMKRLKDEEVHNANYRNLLKKRI